MNKKLSLTFPRKLNAKLPYYLAINLHDSYIFQLSHTHAHANTHTHTQANTRTHTGRSGRAPQKHQLATLLDNGWRGEDFIYVLQWCQVGCRRSEDRTEDTLNLLRVTGN